jgi:hypothetical protein
VDFLIENIMHFEALLKEVFLRNEDQIKVFSLQDLEV